MLLKMKNILHDIMEPPYGGIDCFGIVQSASMNRMISSTR